MRRGSARLGSSLRLQLVATGAGSVVLTAVLLTAVGGLQVAGLARNAGVDIDRLTTASLHQTSDQAMTLVETQVATVQDRMKAELLVAQSSFTLRGALTFGEPETWSVKDASTGATTDVAVPRMLVGGVGFGRNTDPATLSPLVDDIADVLGTATTVFQRVDDAGTMLRVATTVKTADGARAIGTAISPVAADGTPNAVVAALLAGQSYVGNAQVVGQSYVTAYAPLMVGSKVVGALFVGTPQSTVDAPLRTALAGLLHLDESRPDFLSWRVGDLPGPVPYLCRRLGGMPVMTWTVRTPEQRALAEAHADQMVFEGFRP